MEEEWKPVEAGNSRASATCFLSKTSLLGIFTLFLVRGSSAGRGKSNGASATDVRLCPQNGKGDWRKKAATSKRHGSFLI